MGFLDSIKNLFSSKPQQPAPQAQGTAPAAAAATAPAAAAPPAKLTPEQLAQKLERERAQRELDFWGWDEEKKAAWMTKTFESIAQQTEARVIRRADSIEIQAVEDGRHIRISCDISGGAVSCDAKLTNQLGMLILQHDPEVRRPEVIEGDAFAPADDRVFLSDTVFVEDNGMGQGKVVEALDPEVREAILTFMVQYRVPMLMVMPEELKIISIAPLPSLVHPEEVAKNFLKFAANLCALFETSPGVGWTPGVYFNEGERVEIGQHAPAGSSAVMANFTPTVTCDYCSSTVMLNMRSQCPNCGAPLSA